MSKIILEIDATELVRAITMNDLDRQVAGSVFRQIKDYKSSSFEVCSVRHCPSFAKYGASVVSSGSVVFLSQVHTFLNSLWRFA